MELFIAHYLYVKPIKNKGFGVFTNKNIKADTIIEMSPVIVMNDKEKKLLDKTTLYNYIFEWDLELQQCAMAMGYVPVYNHSYNSNCEYHMQFADSNIYIKTVREIKKGEELTVNYNGDWNEEKKIWFEVH